MLNTTIQHEYLLAKSASAMEKQALTAETIQQAIAAMKAKESAGLLSSLFTNTAARFPRLTDASKMADTINDSANSLSSLFFRPSTASLVNDARLGLPSRSSSASTKNLAKSLINQNLNSNAATSKAFNKLVNSGDADATAVADALKGKFPYEALYNL